MTDFCIPIVLEEQTGLARQDEPLTFGAPFPKGVLPEAQAISLTSSRGHILPLQTQVLGRWPDGSVRWLLLDTQCSVPASGQGLLQLRNAESPRPASTQTGIKIRRRGYHLTIDTSAAKFRLPTQTFQPFESVGVAGREYLVGACCTTLLTDQRQNRLRPRIHDVAVETRGGVRSTIKMEGRFENDFARFLVRLHVYAGKSTVRIDFTVHNPGAARHKGGLWDLGDPGSIYFEDLTLRLAGEFATDVTICWRETAEPTAWQSGDRSLRIYQDSSGGENWRSHNHVNRRGQVKHSFRGYRVYRDQEIIARGLRASPTVRISDGRKSLTATVPSFWQNFPKALEADENGVSIRLFPTYYADLFELQGGEQKTHTLFLDFSPPETASDLLWSHHPLRPRIEADWYRACGLVGPLPEEWDEPMLQIHELIQSAVSGERSFFVRREVIDEYGWRNFADLYADHEAVFHTGPEPLVSHYNNQYDVILGALWQYVLTGNRHWFRLADELARHVIDIDIYHTDKDRLEYNHGLFWHTNHYLDAGMGTHRGFSKAHLQRVNQAYGGGPSLSHVYTTGLLWHYYLTGNVASAEAVSELAQFVEGRMKVPLLLSRRAKRAAKLLKHKLETYFKGHKLIDYNKVYELDGPGRASGNALSVLLDAFALTGENKYLSLAEQLIRQCIHPQDDIDSRDLLDVENRWMYTVFLQALGKYLELKTELGLQEEMFDYTRTSLLKYAYWMAENEYVYLAQPEKLEYPNETWAAQELRKCHVLLYAAKHAEERNKTVYICKANFFFKQGLRLLQSFETKNMTRPLALLLQNSLSCNGVRPKLKYPQSGEIAQQVDS